MRSKAIARTPSAIVTAAQRLDVSCVKPEWHATYVEVADWRLGVFDAGIRDLDEGFLNADFGLRIAEFGRLNPLCSMAIFVR